VIPDTLEDLVVTQDKVVRTLVIVVLVLGAAVLALLLLGWLAMAGMMAGGMMSGGTMMGQGSAMPMAGLGIGLIAVPVVLAIIVALVWALRTPAHRAGNG
jgi:hypothetical protein